MTDERNSRRTLADTLESNSTSSASSIFGGGGKKERGEKCGQITAFTGYIKIQDGGVKHDALLLGHDSVAAQCGSCKGRDPLTPPTCIPLRAVGAEVSKEVSYLIRTLFV